MIRLQNQLAPYFLLMSRASVLWIGTAILLVLFIILAGLSEPDSYLAPWVDPAFLGLLIFPAAMGWMGGMIIQEFMHCSFTWTLPRVARRITSGYFVTGLLISLVSAGLAEGATIASHSISALLVIAMGAYCLGGLMVEPNRSWLAVLYTLLALFMLARSRYLSEMSALYPRAAFAVCLGLIVLSLVRLTSRANLRTMPFQPTTPFPGSYFVERSQRFEREKRNRLAPGHTAWRSGFLGTQTQGWVRAAVHESWGLVGWKTVLNSLGRMWALGLLFVLTAWADKGETPFGQALAMTIHDTLIRSPHVTPLAGENVPYAIIILVIAGAGAVLALRSPATLRTGLLYPISRALMAKVNHRAGLVDIGLFFFVVGFILAIVGLIAALLAGHEIHLDFVPFFIRPLTATAILMPLAYLVHLHFLAGPAAQSRHAIVTVIFSVIGFVILVWIWTVVMPQIFSSPLAEFAAMIFLFIGSQTIYSRQLQNFYASADLG